VTSTTSRCPHTPQPTPTRRNVGRAGATKDRSILRSVGCPANHAVAGVAGSNFPIATVTPNPRARTRIGKDGPVHAGIVEGTANAILVRPNQIGTVSETHAVIAQARAAGYATVLSARSGETEEA
jgi:hypothetical protein